MLMKGYKLPLDEAGDAVLKFRITDADVSWHSIYWQSKGGSGQSLSQIEGAPQHNAEPLLAIAEAAA